MSEIWYGKRNKFNNHILMNKRIINGALLGLLVVATPACSFVSCKDYDDDFASIRKELAADKADLEAAKTDLSGQINNLKTQLDAANKKAAELETKMAEYAKQKDLDATNTTVAAQAKSLQDAVAKIATLETQIEGLQKAQTTLQALIDGKVDKSEYDTKVADILSKIAGVKGSVEALEKACDTKYNTLVDADKDLQTKLDAQQKVLDKFEERLKAVATKNFLSAEQIAALQKISTIETTANGNATKIADLTTELNNAKAEITTIKADLAKRPTKAEVEQLIKDAVDPLKDQISKINERLNFLEYNLLVGLELIPDSYYRGIEAIEGTQFKYNAWTVNGLANGVVDYQNHPVKATGLTTSSRYAVATYHINPASAKIDTAAANFKYLPIDAAYRSVSSNLVITVQKASVAEGKLSLVLDIKGATKDIDVDKMVTTAALQYTAPGATPRIITSAYDAIYTLNMSDLALFDIDKNQDAATSKATIVTSWNVNNEGDSIKIADKVRTVGKDNAGVAMNMDNKASDAVSRLTKNGFHYEYHLVKTNAADKAYEAFDLDTKTGVIKAKYDAAKPYANVGKTTTVRVTLVNGSTVAAVGFFNVHVAPKDFVVSNFDNQNELKFTCANTEVAADLYKADVKTIADAVKAKAELEANQWFFVKKTGSDELQQFVLDEHGVATVAPAAKELGVVKVSADGKNLEWNAISKQQLGAGFKAKSAKETYVKVQSNLNPEVRFFVKLNYNPQAEQAAPVATFAGKPISNDWFDNQIRTSEQELRMHFNIDPTNALFNRFDKFQYSINTAYHAGTVQATIPASYSAAVKGSVHSGWRFVTPKEDKVPGTDGKTYTLTVSQDGLNLLANGVKIATITNDQDGTVELLNNATTQVLLNNAGHTELKKLQTLTARVGYVTTVCQNGEKTVLKDTNAKNEFDVKFVRPLDLNFKGEVEFTDANIGTATKSLNFDDVVAFSDWRDRNAAQVLANDHVTLNDLYGVTTFYVANESEWTTNLGGGDLNQTKLVATYGDRGLHLTGGTVATGVPAIAGFTAYGINTLPTFQYTTQQNNFKTYQVKVPVYVGYSWGTFKQDIVVTIKGTVQNSTRRK